MGAPEGGDADDELSVVANRDQCHHAISIVKEYKKGERDCLWGSKCRYRQ